MPSRALSSSSVQYAPKPEFENLRQAQRPRM